MSQQQDEEEAQFVEEALLCVRSNSAGHWPTVAGYLAAEVESQRAAIERVRTLHRQLRHWGLPVCAECSGDLTEHSDDEPYPCPTIRVLAEETSHV